MKFGDMVSIFLAGLIIAFAMFVSYKPQPVNAQIRIPKKPELVIQKTQTALPSECEEFYQKSISNLKSADDYGSENMPTEISVRFYSRSAANGIAYQNCVARNRQ